MKTINAVIVAALGIGAYAWYTGKPATRIDPLDELSQRSKSSGQTACALVEARKTCIRREPLYETTTVYSDDERRVERMDILAFDVAKDADGLVWRVGAAMLLMEPKSRAEARGQAADRLFTEAYRGERPRVSLGSYVWSATLIGGQALRIRAEMVR